MVAVAGSLSEIFVYYPQVGQSWRGRNPSAIRLDPWGGPFIGRQGSAQDSFVRNYRGGPDLCRWHANTRHLRAQCGGRFVRERAAAVSLGSAGLSGHPGRYFLHPTFWHRQGGRAFRAGDFHMVCGDRSVRCAGRVRAPADFAIPESVGRSGLSYTRLETCPATVGGCVSGTDGRGGLVCRPRALRHAAHTHRLVRHRLAGTGAQLSGPGSTAHCGSHGHTQSVFPAGTRCASVSSHLTGHGGGHHSQPGSDLRGVFIDHPGYPARVPAAFPCLLYFRALGRTGVCSGGEQDVGTGMYFVSCGV